MPRDPLTRSLLRAAATLLICAAFGGVLWHGVSAYAQLSGLGSAEGFDANEYYEAPHHTKLKWRITGAKAQPKERSLMLLTGMQLQMFAKTGERRLVVDAPECLYDPAKRTASSPGSLKAQIEEGRFAIEGQGFLWQPTHQTNWMLTLSNDIRSVVLRPTTNASGVTSTTPLVITSRHFEFDTARRRGVFRDDVHAEDPEFELRCGVLTASATDATNTFDSLVAEDQVFLAGKAEGLTATAALAVYSRTNETMTLSGAVKWKQGPQEGSAEQIVIHTREKSLEADGKVAVRLPPDSLGLDGLLASATNSLKQATNHSAPVDLFADHLQVSSNLIVILGSVRIRDETNQLSCDKITIASTATNAADRTAVAEGHVVVCHDGEDQCLRSDRAVFTKATGEAVFTGQPKWKLSPSEGRAERVTVRRSGEVQALGEVAARVELPAQSSSLMNLFPTVGETNQAAARVIEVFAREMNASERQVSLRGDARVHQSPINGREPHLRCETLDLFFATNSHRIELMEAKDQVRFEQGTVGVTNGPDAYRRLTADRLKATWTSPTGALSSFVADQNVVIDAPDTQGHASHATADTLTYKHKIENGTTNQTIELTGHPQLTNALGRLNGDIIVWDLASDRFYTRSYQINLNVGTNVMPKDFTPPGKSKKGNKTK